MTETLGRRIREIRDMREWSLSRTASEANVSAAYVQKLERGQVASPSPHRIRALAEALSVPYLELMRLAGYGTAEAEAAESDAAVKVLAQALKAEDLSADELRELSEYLRFRRQQRRDNP